MITGESETGWIANSSLTVVVCPSDSLMSQIINEDFIFENKICK